MRKSLATLLSPVALMVAGSLSAQSFEGVPAGIVQKEGKYIWFNPQTVLRVGVAIRKESVRKGPYARFSQKYLGVIAPLNDRDIYSIVSASISYVDPTSDLASSGGQIFGSQGGTVATAPQLLPVMSSDTGFVRLPLNVLSAVAKTPEEMAADAAAAIFRIRKQRSDLISGEAGENVFGAGLSGALDELRRQEQEYLELFLGKQFTQQISRTFEIVPDSGNFSYAVCRVSENDGFVRNGGVVITLELSPEKSAIPAPPPRSGKDVTFTSCLFPAITTCRLTDGVREFDTARLPVYQYGTLFDVIIPKK